MNKHTPTPWYVGELNGSGIQICHSDNSPGAISKNLAVVTARQTWLKEAEANAQYIVRCVNSHEALVKALQDLTQAVANLDSPEGGLGGLGYLNESADRAEAVLAAAGEQP